jgi:hypothetical protein
VLSPDTLGLILLLSKMGMPIRLPRGPDSLAQHRRLALLELDPLLVVLHQLLNPLLSLA